MMQQNSITPQMVKLATKMDTVTHAEPLGIRPPHLCAIPPPGTFCKDNIIEPLTYKVKNIVPPVFMLEDAVEKKDLKVCFRYPIYLLYTYINCPKVDRELSKISAQAGVP